MPARATRYLILGQVSSFIFLAICIALVPKYLFAHNEGGLSNFGVQPKTVVPFTVAFLSSSYYLFKAAQATKARSKLHRRLRHLLQLVAGFQVLLLLSTYPYKLNHSLGWIHLLVQTILLPLELSAGGWLVLRVTKNNTARLLFGFQVVAAILLVLTAIGHLHVLFLAQIISQLSFGLLLIKTWMSLAYISVRRAR